MWSLFARASSKRAWSAAHRPFSSSTASSASGASTAAPPNITTWINHLTSQAPSIRHDIVDPHRLLQLQKTLPTRNGPLALVDSLNTFRHGAQMPNGHHLVLFQPETALNNLGADGSSTVSWSDSTLSDIQKELLMDHQEYNAPSPYSRRMWAGGSFEWNPARPLIVGQNVIEKTSVSNVDFKNNMLFVNQEKTFHVEGESAGWSVKEMRTHVFRTNQGVHVKKGSNATQGGEFTCMSSDPHHDHTRYSGASWSKDNAQ